MDFLIAFFGGIWLLWNWISEESSKEATRRIRERIDREKKALNPDSETRLKASRFADDHKNIVLMRYREPLEQIFGKDYVRYSLDSDWGYKGVNRDVVIAFMLAEKGFYQPYSPISRRSQSMDGKNIITYYRILEEMLHKAGKNDVKFYLSIGRQADGTRPDFKGEVGFEDEFVLEQEKNREIKCVRLWH